MTWVRLKTLFQFAGPVAEESYSDSTLFLDTYYHQLAADLVYCSGASRNGLVDGESRQKLKRQSLEAQGKWSDTMSQLEETLGGLRIIKAFIAEDKMVDRFTKCSNELRDATNRVAIRQALAHPMSEFLGTLLIVLVLWFGGILILGNDHSSLEAPTFIFYMVILIVSSTR